MRPEHDFVVFADDVEGLDVSLDQDAVQPERRLDRRSPVPRFVEGDFDRKIVHFFVDAVDGDDDPKKNI